MIFETESLVFLQPILALVLLFTGASAAEDVTTSSLKHSGEITPKNIKHVNERSSVVHKVDLESEEYEVLRSSEERECPRPKKEFWHPKFKRCVPYCRNGKRDRTTGLCVSLNTNTNHQPSWNNEDNVYIPRHGQRMSPPKGSQMVYRGMRARMSDARSRIRGKYRQQKVQMKNREQPKTNS